MLSIVFCSLLCQSESASDIRTDRKLDKTLSLTFVMTPLKTVVAALAKEAGETISVTRELSEHKVNLIFHDRKISDVMRALADCLWLEWIPTKGSGFQLRAPRNLKSDITKQELFEKDRARTALQARVNRLSLYVKPLDELWNMYLSAASALALHGNNPFPGREKLEQTAEDLKVPYWVPIGESLKMGLGTPIQDIFENGQVSLFSDGGSGKASLDCARLMPVALLNGKQQEFYGCSARLTWNPLGQEVSGEFFFESDVEDITSCKRLSLPLTLNSDIIRGPLTKRFDSWSRADDPTLLGRKLDSDKASFGESPYRVGMSSLGDHLRYISEAADVSVVSDAYRVAVSYPKPYTGRTVGAYLNQLVHEAVEGAPLIKPGGYRTNDGWLMVRHQSFWHLDETEIAESDLARLENALKKNQPLTVDEYADFATQLRPEQSAAFGTDRIGLFEFSNRPFEFSWPILRLWGVLSPEQRAFAKENGLDITTLSPNALHYLGDVLDYWAWNVGRPHVLAGKVRRNPAQLNTGILRCAVNPSHGLDMEIFPLGGRRRVPSNFGPDQTFTINLNLAVQLRLGTVSTDLP